MTYIIDPFAVAGDQTVIPFPTQGDGSVSFDQGFGPDYSLELVTYPAAKATPRSGLNYLFNVITTELQQYQQVGIPNFITTSDNGGTPFPYRNGIIVVHSDTIYRSLCDNNTDTPPTAQWQPVNINFSGTSTGSSGNAIQVNIATPININFNGTQAEIIINHNNTGATTVQVGTAAAVPVRVAGPSGLVALSGGELVTGMKALFLYDGTFAQLINPAVPTALSGYVTITEFQLANFITGNDSGTPNNIVVTGLTGYPTPAGGTGPRVFVKMGTGNTNTGSVEITINGMGPFSLRYISGSGRVDLVGGELQENGIYELMWDSASFIVLNPTPPPIGAYAQVTFGPTSFQNIAAASNSIVQFNSVVNDPRGWWNSGAFKFVPTLPGRYSISGQVLGYPTLAPQILKVFLNASVVSQINNTAAGVGASLLLQIPAFSVVLDGVTDSVSLNWSNTDPSLVTPLGYYAGAIVPNPGNLGSFFQIQYMGIN